MELTLLDLHLLAVVVEIHALHACYLNVAADYRTTVNSITTLYFRIISKSP